MAIKKTTSRKQLLYRPEDKDTSDSLIEKIVDLDAEDEHYRIETIKLIRKYPKSDTATRATLRKQLYKIDKYRLGLRDQKDACTKALLRIRR